MRSSNKDNNQQVVSREAEVLVPVPKSLPRRLYGVSRGGEIRDLAGIASVSIFSGSLPRAAYHAAQQRLQGLIQKHVGGKASARMADLTSDLNQFQSDQNLDIRFFYPVMQPAVTNKIKLLQAQESLQQILNKTDAQVRFSSHRKNAQQTLAKFASEQDHVEREIANRSAMQEILQRINVPMPFKQFMAVISELSVEHKRALVRMTMQKESLSFKKEIRKAPYEIMFAYDGARDDFTLGIRAAYDHDHPHPTLLGGLNPVVVVAGTFDFALKDNQLQIAKIRIDSGHFKPDADALEIVLRYIKQELNPEYYDALVLHTVEGDTRTPEIVVTNKKIK